MFGIKSGTVNVDDTFVDYVTLGKGNKSLVIIPGLGDGLGSVKGKEILYYYLNRSFAKKFRVFIISRRNVLREDFSTIDMADDVVKVMDVLGLERAYVMGISQGGMILEWMAIRYPEKIEKMVLAVTTSRSNPIMMETVRRWIDLTQNGKMVALSKDIFANSYTDKYLGKLKLVYPFLGFVVKDKNRDRFIIQANSCLRHNAYLELDKIKVPTLIMGAEMDEILGADASYEMASKIKDSEMHICKGFGHGVYNESQEFKDIVMKFFD